MESKSGVVSLHLFDGVVWCGRGRCVATRAQEPTRMWKRGGVPAEETILEEGNRPCARGDGLRLVRRTYAVVAQAQTVRLRRR